jgi:folate-binding Fe-S cluster repair protein YgfZ
MGQELTARTRYRGLIKRRLLPVAADTGLPPANTPIFAGARDIGEMRSSRGTIGLATLRLDALDASELRAGGQELRIRIPSWVKRPASAASQP